MSRLDAAPLAGDADVVTLQKVEAEESVKAFDAGHAAHVMQPMKPMPPMQIMTSHANADGTDDDDAGNMEMRMGGLRMEQHLSRAND